MSFFLQTSQVPQIKIAFDTIKEIIQDVNIHFISDREPNAGVLLTAMDASHCALVHFRMDKAEIEKMGKYKYAYPPLPVLTAQK